MKHLWYKMFDSLVYSENCDIIDTYMLTEILMIILSNYQLRNMDSNNFLINYKDIEYIVDYDNFYNSIEITIENELSGIWLEACLTQKQLKKLRKKFERKVVTNGLEESFS